MNRGLCMRAARELWPTTVVLGLVLAGAEAILAYTLPKFGAQFGQQWLQIEFMRGIMQAMLGTEIVDRIGPQMFQSIAWVHPVPLALTWAHALLCCTRVPAGEVDRGTADILFGLPVSRWEVFFSETAVWLGAGMLVLAATLAGNLLGSLALPAELRPDLPRLLIVVTNLYCLYLAVGGMAWLISSLSVRRGKAITILFVVQLALFLLNYLAQFWKPLSKIAFLSPLHFYKPTRVLTAGTWPVQDLAVLLAVGCVCWIAGGLVLARRDL